MNKKIREESVDLLDRLVSDWKRECPELDVDPMEIVGRILHLGKILEKRAGDSLKDSGVFYTDLDVLATLRRSGEPYELSPTELRKSVLITSGAMTALLDRLEKKELIYRRPSEKDGRVFIAGLTKEGVVAIEEVIAHRFEEAKSSIAVFDESEQEMLAGLLKKMMLFLEPS
ncbi:MarR family winged helix-turn-helix transcriptional regulator [Aquimarina hainanensis]|uniref:MarR family winged helix-turn-helix transcriptional regulator n=1 Tax=Aquimarina hainanensis TaxID=1578017 RepID=A0ABW5N947_9FLAO